MNALSAVPVSGVNNHSTQAVFTQNSQSFHKNNLPTDYDYHSLPLMGGNSLKLQDKSS